jgi:hypothetical protein
LTFSHIGGILVSQAKEIGMKEKVEEILQWFEDGFITKEEATAKIMELIEHGIRD